MGTPVAEPRIARFERLAYGLFLHWGLYSQLGRGEWAMHSDKMPKEQYARLKDTFTATDFDAHLIARFAREAGMRYITLTTRHHEGFSLYDTRGLDDFDAPHSPAGRDLVAEFVEACRAEGIVPILYHTTLDWRWESHACDDRRFDAYLDYLHASVEILCTHYGPIGGLWFDGNWSRPQADWKEDRLYGVIRRYQPDAMIINNTGLSAGGKTGNPEIDSVTFEQSLPGPMDRNGWPKYVAGEMCQTMNAHWGIGARDFMYLSPAEVIERLCLCRKTGANLLLNVGLTATGAIPDYEAAALRRAGEWVALHEAPIREGKPCAVTAMGRDFVLEANGKLYVFVFNLSIGGHANVTVSFGGSGPRALKGVLKPIRQVCWMDSGETLLFAQDPASGVVAIDFTPYSYGTHLVVRLAEIQLE